MSGICPQLFQFRGVGVDTTIILMAGCWPNVGVVIAGGWVCGVHYTVLSPSTPTPLPLTSAPMLLSTALLLQYVPSCFLTSLQVCSIVNCPQPFIQQVFPEHWLMVLAPV